MPVALSVSAAASVVAPSPSLKLFAPAATAPAGGYWSELAGLFKSVSDAYAGFKAAEAHHRYVSSGVTPEGWSEKSAEKLEVAKSAYLEAVASASPVVENLWEAALSSLPD